MGRTITACSRHRRAVLAALAATGLAPIVARAQPAKRPVSLGFLRIVEPPQVYVVALEQGLRDRGYTPGQDVSIDYRFGDGREESLKRHARELVDRKVALIIAAGNQATVAAKEATRSVPIVMAVANDPIAMGLVSSLAHPGGNVTGTTIVSSDLAGKRLELLKEVLPNATRVAVLMKKASQAHAVAWKATVEAASPLGLRPLPFEVVDAAGFDQAFADMVKSQAQAVVILEDATFTSERKRIVALASQARLPAIYGQRNSVEDGGFISYGPSIEEAYRNAGSFVDRILKGAKPAQIPIEQPRKFEFVINMKAAQSLGVAISQKVLVREPEMIQ